jgi:hypothetical protein
MQKNTILLLLTISLVFNVILEILFSLERKSTEFYKKQFITSLVNATNNFEEYISGHEEAYVYGIGNVNTALHMIHNYDEKSLAYRYKNNINELYGYMVVSPEKVKPHISKITDAFKLLTENNNNGYVKIQEILNLIKS